MKRLRKYGYRVVKPIRSAPVSTLKFLINEIDFSLLKAADESSGSEVQLVFVAVAYVDVEHA